MNFELAIIDDDIIHTSMIRQFLKLYEKSSGIHFHISLFCCASDFLSSEMLNFYDLLILGIDLPDITGIQLLEHLKKINIEPVVIIATRHTEYALDAYTHHVQAYIVKPVNAENLFITLNRIMPLIQAKSMLDTRDDFLQIRRNGIPYSLPTSEILFLEKYRNKVHIYTDTACYQSYYTIRELNNKLNPEQFVQIHQGCLVNWDRVSSLDAHYITVGTHRLMITNSYYKAVLFHQQTHPIKCNV